jgi:hypothetical protein
LNSAVAIGQNDKSRQPYRVSTQVDHNPDAGGSADVAIRSL